MNGKMAVNLNGWEKEQCPILRYYLNICLEELRE
jgi:hypothetical protein